MNNFAVRELYSEKHTQLPGVNSLLKISLGLILFTMISTVLVYAETIPVTVEGNSFDVEYDVTGMTLSGIEVDTDFISLILTVDVTASAGTLNITFDREFFDSTFEGLDDDFIILADGDEPTFTETENTSQIRTLSIELPPGTEEVEIIGSVFGDSPLTETPDTTDDDADAAAAKAAADAAAAKAAADAAAAKAAADAAAKADKTQCGPGTILKDGACVLDERCGPGTVLEDGACVVDPTSKSPQISVKGLGKELVVGIIVAFVAAGIVGLVFAIISRASKSS